MPQQGLGDGAGNFPLGVLLQSTMGEGHCLTLCHWQLSYMPQLEFKPWQWWETGCSQWQCLRPLGHHVCPPHSVSFCLGHTPGPVHSVYNIVLMGVASCHSIIMLAIFTICTIAPEMYVRGYVLQRWGALLISSLRKSSLHSSWIWMVSLFILGHNMGSSFWAVWSPADQESTGSSVHTRE